MYESLTALIPALKTDNFGEWIVDRENDGTPEHPIQFPFVNYGEAVQGLEKEIYAFEKQHPDFGLKRYNDILNENEIEWGLDSMKKADVSNLDGRTVMALCWVLSEQNDSVMEHYSIFVKMEVLSNGLNGLRK